VSGAVLVEFSRDCPTSLAELPGHLRGVDPETVARRVIAFAEFKEANGHVPFTLHGEDKPSPPARDGRPVPFFRDDRIHYCHLSLVCADPIVVYRLSEPRRLVIICVTTHAAMFRGDKRRFVSRYSSYFPATLSRRPGLRPRPRPES
jgi:hypothetical protein